MATGNEAGGWVIDPKNPDRATYTDEFGDTYETFRQQTSMVPLADSTATPEEQYRAQQTYLESPEAQKSLLTQALERRGGLGFSPETRAKWGMDNQDGIGGIPGRALFGAAQTVSDALTLGGSVGEVAALGIDDAIDQTGINSLAEKYLPGKIQPGRALLALAEAFPAGGLEAGMLPRVNPGKSQAGGPSLADQRLAYEADQAFVAKTQELFKNPDVTRAEFDSLAQSEGRAPFGPELDDALDARNNRVQFVSQIQNVEDANTLRVQYGLDNQNIATRIFRTEVTNPDAPRTVDAAVEHVNSVVKDWKNAPPIEIADDFANLADETLRNSLDPTAVGVTLSDGRVLINLKNLAEEARLRNVTQEDMLSAVTYHEALGHYGLAQKFGEDLDDILMNLYDNSKDSFKTRVDDWEADNPGAYADDANPKARAAEEVLAEMSEKGEIAPELMDQFRNWLKQTGRDFGLDLKYSDGEIRTILGMAHDSVRNGNARDVMSNGFRYARVYHGSTKDFDEFENRDDGTKLLGYGTYASRDPEYAKMYKGPTGKLYELDLPDNEWGNWDAPLDLQPKVRDAFKRAGFEARREGQTLGEVYKDASFEFGDKEVSARLNKEGIRGHTYQDYDGTENFVIFNPKDANIVNKYMRRSDKQKERADEARRSRSINIDNISNVKDIDYILERANELAPEGEGRVSREVTERLARDLGLTPARLMKPGMDESGLASRIEAGTQLLVNQIGKIDSILSKMNTASIKQQASLQIQFSREMATLAAIYGRVAGNNSEVGRALNILNKVRSAKGTAEEVLKYMAKTNNVLGNPANAQQLANIIQNTPNPATKIKLARAAMKPRAEDYIFRIWYNMMLSSPATHAANLAGTFGNFAVDLMEKTGASVLGQGKRFSNSDRIRGREIAYRMYGAVSALIDGSTWQNTIDSYKSGLTGNVVNSKSGGINVYRGSNKVLRVGSYVLEGPTRALAAEDEWWRNVISLSNIYGLAVRNAGNKGLTGKAFWNEVENLKNNPTQEMIDATNDYTKVLQFLDKPSRVARAINKASDINDKTSIGGRAFSTGMKFIVPFVNTPDALIRTSLRRTPLGAMERENIKGWKAGGAERDQVVSRMIMGPLLSAWVASKALDGDITGEGPSDPRKRLEWEAAHQPNSIKINGKQYSVAGLEPVSTNLTAVATLVERYKAGEMTKDDYLGSAVNAATGLGKVLMENSYTENLKNLFKVLEGDDTAAANLIGGIAGNVASPAISRTIARTQDSQVRDTTGDGSMTDRISGRIQSGGFNSDELPQRYDVYGQPMERDLAGPDVLSRVQRREEESDPAIKELNRLVDVSSDSVVVGAPGKTVKVGDTERRLTAEEYQQYQRLSGLWIVETVRAEMETEEWKNSDDSGKIATVRSIVKDMRANARETLFQQNDDGDEE